MQLASASNEPEQGGVGRSKISGSVRQCNFRWWPRRFAVQVKSYEAERACGLTFHFSVRHVDACETRAAREGIKRPCGPEKSKYRQRCQGVQVSDGLGGQVQLRDFGRLASGNSRILV